MYPFKIHDKRSLKFEENNGFTIVEFLIVVAIIGLLITFMNPLSNFVTQKAREREGSLLIRSL